RRGGYGPRTGTGWATRRVAAQETATIVAATAKHGASTGARGAAAGSRLAGGDRDARKRGAAYSAGRWEGPRCRWRGERRCRPEGPGGVARPQKFLRAGGPAARHRHHRRISGGEQPGGQDKDW